MMVGVGMLAIAIGQVAVSQEIDFVWYRRAPAERQATAEKIVSLFWGAGNTSAVSVRRADLRGSTWIADFDASGTPVRVQHDGDSDEWLLNRTDLVPVQALSISQDDASREFLAIKDQLVAVGLLDGPNFADCAPEIAETRMGGGSESAPRAEQVVELTARCRATHAGVPVLNLGVQARFRAGGLSSIRFSRARAVAKTSTVAVSRPAPLSASAVAQQWPRLQVKENSVVYLAEGKPGSGVTSARLVQLIAGAERFEGGVSRTRILVKRSGEAVWVEPTLGEKFSQAQEPR